MQIIRSPADADAADPELRQLISKTIQALSVDSPYDPDELGHILIVEPGDTMDRLNAHIGFNILTNRYSGIRFDQPGFTPSFEIIQEHAGHYELIFIISDDGLGITVFLPKIVALPELLAMCIEHALPPEPMP